MIVGIDLGTTSNRCIAISKEGTIKAKAQKEFTQHFPKPAWVEHNALEIWDTTLGLLQEVLQAINMHSTPVLAITNQRETVVAWDKSTGQPLAPAIVWQCRRTADRIQSLSDTEKKMIQDKTGLIPDAYFSASKMEWLVQHVPAVKEAAKEEKLCFGTIDSWIIWKLTSGKSFVTDTSNASRTMLFNIHAMAYDAELLGLFGIQKEWLPEPKASNAHFGITDPDITGIDLPIHAVLGDQQASLFAQCGSNPNQVKNTYGTGLFICACTQSKILTNSNLISTVAWTFGKTTEYAVEGSVFVGGSAVQWLRDELGIIQNAGETEQLAMSIKENDGVYFVPALTGLGAPHWDSKARGLLIGITRGTTKSHIARAVLESLAYQTRDVLEEIQQTFTTLKVDGGAIENQFLMQFQADVCGIRVEKPIMTETTVLGVVAVAGIATGLFTEAEFRENLVTDKHYNPMFKKDKMDVYYKQWKDALNRSQKWST